MRYLGGKASQGRKIAEIIDSTSPDRVVIPFCGALNIEVHLRAPIVESYDACEALITMWKAVQAGWEPPSTLSREEWQALKDAQDPHDPMTAFAGFGCSFGGKWFAGYATNDDRADESIGKRRKSPRFNDWAGAASRSIGRKRPKIQRVRFAHHHWPPPIGERPCTIYCDPPYADTTGYGAVGAFDHAGFIGDCEDLAARGHRVLVTEYANPRGWACRHVFQRRKRLSASTSRVRDELLLEVPRPGHALKWAQQDLLTVTG